MNLVKNGVERNQKKTVSDGRHFLLLSILVIVFFVCIVLTYYGMVYKERREHFFLNGEMRAKQLADQVENYLNINFDSVRFSALAVDDMIRRGCSDEEIQEYLVGETAAIRSVVSENATGLYGYINGRFFSGTRWEPPADFVATERPWYLKPMSDKGNLTMLDPYQDAQTGEIMLAIGLTLNDGVSVVSVDVSLERIQEITEEAVRGNLSDVQMILNERGMVIAHSDKNEIGKEYGGGTDSLGERIFGQIRTQSEDSFECVYGGKRYFVYVTDIGDSWKCISLMDAAAAFRSLNLFLAGTIVVVIAMVTVISIILLRSKRRSNLARRLNTQLSSTADIYISLHEIDFTRDTFIEVRNIREDAEELLGKKRDECQKVIRRVMTKVSDASTRDKILDFVNFAKIDRRLKDRNTVTCEFMSDKGKWRRARYIVSKRRSDGSVARAMYLIEDIDREKRERDNMLNSVKSMNAQIETLTEEVTQDTLTGVYNKTSGSEKITELCRKKKGALMVIDLDNFKLVNDLHGHEMGDKVLCAFADILRSLSSDGDVICRIGGDEFMAYSVGITTEKAVAEYTEALNEKMSEKCRSLLGEDFDIPIGASVGAAFAPEHSDEYVRLFEYADSSMYRVKTAGKHDCCVYRAHSETENGTKELDAELVRLTQIMEERGDGSGALLLGMEDFIVNYRYIMRYIRRYGKRADKAIISLEVKEEQRKKDLGIIVREFAGVLQKTFRNSDIIMQYKEDMFVLLLPEMGDKTIADVMERVLATWKETPYADTVEVRYVSAAIKYREAPVEA